MYDCVIRHYRRHDFRDLCIRTGKMPREEYYRSLESNDRNAFWLPAGNIAKEAARRIAERRLGLPPVVIRERCDKSSGKRRLIGRESAMQQVFDHIAVNSCSEIWKRRIVPEQASSIPGRGQVYGMKKILSWIRKDNRAMRWSKKHGKRYNSRCRYFVKLDIRQCYRSMRKEVFMEFFRRDCANEDIMWLWDELLGSHRVPIEGGEKGEIYEGFMIGALPSQWACQYLMTFAYRCLKGLRRKRKGLQVRLVNNILVYMDDILVMGSARKHLLMAVRTACIWIREWLGLEVKGHWQVMELAAAPVDMMEFRIHREGRTSVRPRIFLRARRAALRFLRRGRMTVKQAQHIISYKGYFTSTNSRMAMEKLKLQRVFQAAALIIGREERKRNYGIYGIV